MKPVVKKGQVWAYQRTSPQKLAPVIHVITRADESSCEATSIFTDNGKVHERVPANALGLAHMVAGNDPVGTWTLLLDSP